jgi:malate/lactate dehydrogenase
MKVAVLGTGNVGANLVLQLAKLPVVKVLQLYSANRQSSESALLDTASCIPDCAQKLEIVEDIEADIVVISAGLQPYATSSDEELLNANRKITFEMIERVQIKPKTIIIAVATPVDIIAKEVQRITCLPCCQVFGFGGDLDLNRLRFTLRSMGVCTEGITIIGEHGKNTIPVYAGEMKYDLIATEVRTFLSRISSRNSVIRNLASGELLARLVESIAEDRRRVHCVTCYHPQFDDWFTWPCIVGRSGAVSLQSPAIGPLAAAKLEALIQARSTPNSNS